MISKTFRILVQKLYLLALYALCCNVCFAQAFSSGNNLHSPHNILAFADFLYCEKDYLRAIDEYKKYLSSTQNDSVQFKIVKSYELMGNFLQAEQELVYIKSFPHNYLFYERVKLKYKLDDFIALKSLYENNHSYINSNGQLYYLSYLFTSDILPDRDTMIAVFDNKYKETISGFYSRRISPEYKSPVVAGILSTVIPGAGKLYTGNIGDGITSAVITGLMAFISYDNFRASHPVRGWIFASLTALFYGGNIYGSVASANIYNASMDLEYEKQLKHFIEQHNYFLPEDNFDCK